MNIGTPRKELPEYTNDQFDSLEDYYKLAKHLIQTEVPKYSPGLAQNILNNEECIANIANVLMMADWKWNKQGSKYGYRKQCVIWAIQSVVNQYKKHGKFRVENLLYDETILDQTYEDFLHKREIHELVLDITNSKRLSDKQREYIRLKYIDGYTLQEIGDKYDVSRQNVQQTIQKGINTLKYEYSNRSLNNTD